MMFAPTHDSLMAEVARAISPSYGWCGRCGTPWRFTDPWSVNYTDNDGVFALCKPCFMSLEPVDRLPYYWSIVNVGWLRPDLWSAVEQAILGGEPT